MRWHWKHQITLWHVLTHQAGMSSALPAKMTMKSFASCEDCCAAFEYNETCPQDTLLPVYGPGQKSEYYYLSFGWLVVGTLCGAYAKKHGLVSVSFEAVYKAILHPKLSSATKASGFRPCVGSGGHALAKICTSDIDASKLLQRLRESLAITRPQRAVDFRQPDWRISTTTLAAPGAFWILKWSALSHLFWSTIWVSVRYKEHRAL